MAGSFGFGDFAGVGEGGFRVLGDEVQRALHDASHGFAMAVGNGQKTEVVPFAQEGIGRRHVTLGHHRAAAHGEEVD